LEAGVAALGIIFAAFIVMGQAPRSRVSPMLEAEQFVLRDKQGKELVRLGIQVDGQPRLTRADASGAVRRWRPPASAASAHSATTGGKVMGEYSVKRPLKRPPIHPGEVMREDVLPALGLSVSEAARRLKDELARIEPATSVSSSA
jgi:hypothetical protein